MTEEIDRSIQLRAQGKFAEAVAVIEDALPSYDTETKLVALLQAFYAARDGNLRSKATELARQIRELEPGTPSIEDYV